MTELSIYPVVIEPSADVIPLTVPDHMANIINWREFRRAPADTVRAALPDLPADLVHFFVPHDFENALTLLCYTANGQLSLLMQRQPGMVGIWESYDVISLILKGLVSMPEVRLIFQTERARAAFLYYLASIKEGKVNCPSLAVVMDKFVCDPISCETDWTE